MPDPSPRDIPAEVAGFFHTYEERFNEALHNQRPAKSVAVLYAEAMLAAHPEGVDAGMNGQDFEDTLDQGFQYYRILGTQGMQIQAVDVTPIDELHAMARVRWRASYLRPSDGQSVDIDFENVYFVQNLTPEKPAGWKVFAYITGDEQAEYEKHGLA